MVVHKDLTAEAIRLVFKKLGAENFSDHDALVSDVTHEYSIKMHCANSLSV